MSRVVGTILLLVMGALTLPVSARQIDIATYSDPHFGNLCSGGNIGYFHFKVIEFSRDAVVIGCNCVSACSMFLAVPNVCIAQWVSLGFHRSNELNAEADVEIARHYRPGLRQQFYQWIARGAFGFNNRPIWLSAQQLRLLYGYRVC